ncbi:MAG: tRNA pseudouridine(38-40) synthase TruA [Candidatus Omnitrophica bacterium]|nr:tRNA pseudouridine(38-40) synthase TruA [Candidatus Omnitrophota bacterium]
MRTLKLTIAYDGTRYAGWQVQRSNTHDARRTTQKPTVQGTLERVLQSILREPVKVVGSGRTDAGVHALSQIAHVKTRSTLTRERLLRSVNALLPPDVAVTAVDEADEAFHARFTACRKRYRYRMFTGAVVPPFIRPYVHHVRAPLNLAAMRREAALLKGAHDFKAFAHAGGAPRATTRRRMTHVELRRRGEEIQLDLEGNGFLHTMVRSIAGTLIDVGRGRLPAGTVRRLLRTGERRLAGATAPARGLALVSVTYRGQEA